MNNSEDNIVVDIKSGCRTAFVDATYNSNLAYRPEFVYNDHTQGRKVVSSLEEELNRCDEFMFSVAFITKSGITPLLQTLADLEARNIPGKILTTNYLDFTDPEALDTLAGLKNVELRMYCTGPETVDFHTKGYIFRKDDIYRIIVGSSNMTQKAITRTHEWNTKIVSTSEGAMVKDILQEFRGLWDNEHTYSYEEVIEEYRKSHKISKEQKKLAARESIASFEQYKLMPNKMQLGFIDNLKELVDNGAKRALLLSSTGTGKTYASAFAVRDQKPERLLFVVHREQIAKQAMKSYRKVFGSSKRLALLSGNEKDFKAIMEADFVFSTMQMMAKKEIHSRFSRDEFKYIIIDEVHRAGAESYQRIMSYYEPELWLGMTASPERTDGFDIYNLFDHNIAYEIRLQQALEEDLLCPFHYFGITDIEIDGEVLDDTTGMRNFNRLVCDSRVDYIIEKARYYGHSGSRVKGLVFCSRRSEAEELSNKFNQRGYHTIFLGGDNSQEERERAIDRLEQDELENSLDYIFTVDIFNEGVDIPQINQVIMLRPTESPVVFVQQLGRGLRKADDKEYVVIVDFIGNYLNNFMIPIALSGDRSYNKDTIRRYVREGVKVIPGSSTIHFDEVSKKRIYASIDQVTTKKKFLIEKYTSLKHKLGRIPSIVDFYEYGEIDPMLFIEYADNYHTFCQIADKDYKMRLSKEEETIISFVSNLLINGKRPCELMILKMLLEQEQFTKEDIKDVLKDKYGDRFTNKTIDASISVLKGEFINSASDKKKYADIDLLPDNEGMYGRVASYIHGLSHADFYKQMKDLIELGLRRYEDFYGGKEDEIGLVLYQKYSRKDVCRLLNWDKDESSTMYGYKCKHGTCPIFVTYEKKDDITSSTKYEDEFINSGLFSWMTRNRVSVDSVESQQIIHYKDNGLKIPLFIKKSDGEGSDFYYMGQVEPVEWKQTTIKNDKGQELPIMNFKMALKNSVRDDIYDYFTK